MSKFSNVISTIYQIKDEQLLEDFLIGITTSKERQELSKRLEIVKRLIEGQPQHQIAQELGVGIATVTRGSKEMALGHFKSLRNNNE